jgi:hypothetical protein
MEFWFVTAMSRIYAILLTVTIYPFTALFMCRKKESIFLAVINCILTDYSYEMAISATLPWVNLCVPPIQLNEKSSASLQKESKYW